MLRLRGTELNSRPPSEDPEGSPEGALPLSHPGMEKARTALKEPASFVR